MDYITTPGQGQVLCRKCKEPLPDGAVYCCKCGVKQEQAQRKPRSRGNGTGSAYRRGKTWEAAVVLGYTEKDGKLKCIRKTKGGFKTKREALEYIQILKTEQEKKVPTLTYLWDAYKAGQYKKLSKSKQQAYGYAWNKLEKLHFRKIDTITTPEMQEIINEKAPTHDPAKDIKSLLSKLYQIAMANQYVTINLSQFLVLPECATKEREAFTEEEIEKLWEHYGSGNDWAGYILLMCYTGMMPGELMEAKKENIDWYGKQILRSGIKTATRRATPLVLADVIIPVLDHLCSQAPGEKICPINKDRFYKVYYDTVEGAGVRRLAPYSCRHTTGTALALAHIPPSVIQKIMRHSKFSTTERYIHVDMGTCLAAVNQI